MPQIEEKQNLKTTIKISLRLIKLIWSIDRFFLSVGVLVTIIPSIIPFINIYIYKLIIDLVVASVNGQAFEYSSLYLLLGIRVLTYFLQDFSWRTQEYAERLLWARLPIKLHEIIFTKINSLDMQYFEDSKFKDLLQKVRDNFYFRPQQIISYLIFLLQSSIQVAIAFVALVSLNWVFIFVVALIAIPEFINQSKEVKLSWGVWSGNTPYRKRYWYLANLLQDAGPLKELRIFQLGKHFIDEVIKIDNKFYHESRSVLTKNYKVGVSLNGLSTIVFVGIEVFVIFQALARKITIGDIGFYTGVITNFQQGLSGLFRNINGVFENTLYIQSIFDLLDAKPLLKQPENPTALSLERPPVIEFRNVVFSYPGSSVKVLDNFSLIIESGEKIALVGENGAGKSTIIKLLARFYDVTEGEILINRINIKDVNIKEWYQYLGILFQDFNRYEDTVKENIQFGRIEIADKDAIVHASHSAGADEVIIKLDKRYEQMLGTTFDEGQELSTGQWQKIALARAFFRDASVLILDEPTASIDAKAEAEIFARVEKLSKGKSVIIISHRFSTVRNADRIIVLKNGRIIEQGSHEELMKKKGLYEELFSIQAKGYK